jgi:hypothetical protein
MRAWCRARLELAQFLLMSSTQLIQKEESAGKDEQRNPKMDVSQDRAQQIAGTAGGRVGHDWTSMRLLNLDSHLRE